MQKDEAMQQSMIFSDGHKILAGSLPSQQPEMS